MRAERRAGEMLSQTEKATGMLKRGPAVDANDHGKPTLAQMGITEEYPLKPMIGHHAYPPYARSQYGDDRGWWGMTTFENPSSRHREGVDNRSMHLISPKRGMPPQSGGCAAKYQEADCASHDGDWQMSRLLAFLGRLGLAGFALVTSALITGCASMIANVNSKILPVNQWYEQDYEATRFTRYKFTKADVGTVRAAVLKTLPRVGLTPAYSADDIVASGNPTTMFTTAECESWADIDRAKTKELSSGLLVLTCNQSNKNSLITARLSLKGLSAGTLMILEYELNNPANAAHGVVGPHRPPPAAAKAGAAKFWDMLGQSLPEPIRNATKEDLS